MSNSDNDPELDIFSNGEKLVLERDTQQVLELLQNMKPSAPAVPDPIMDVALIDDLDIDLEGPDFVQPSAPSREPLVNEPNGQIRIRDGQLLGIEPLVKIPSRRQPELMDEEPVDIDKEPVDIDKETVDIDDDIDDSPILNRRTHENTQRNTRKRSRESFESLNLEEIDAKRNNVHKIEAEIAKAELKL